MTNNLTDTSKSTDSTEGTRGGAPAGGARTEGAGAATSATPGPWDAPWHRKGDATGWETVYRGTGQRRPSKSVVELELTAAQDEWLNVAAKAVGLTPHQFLRNLIDDARRAAPAKQPEPIATDAG